MMVKNRRKSKHEQMRKRFEVYKSRHRILSRMRIETPKGIESILKEIRKEETSQFDWVPGYAGAWKAQRRWT